MAEITKELFLRQKIANFIIFIEQKIGKENSIYSEFCAYQADLNKFLQMIIQVSNFTKNNLSHDNIQKYLEFKGVSAVLLKDDLDKIVRYYQMFIKIINL